MEISKSILWVIIIILFITLLAQNKVLHDRINNQPKYEFIEGGDILKAQTIDSLKNLSDSLYAENFPCQIELNRYRVAYEIFMERNPKAAKQYGTIISEETE